MYCYVIMARNELIANDGYIIKVGDIFSIPVDDIDEGTTWTFRYCMKPYSQFVYLGGGIDFGTAIGKIVTREELDREIENSDPLDGGIKILLKAYT